MFSRSLMDPVIALFFERLFFDFERHFFDFFETDKSNSAFIYRPSCSQSGTLPNYVLRPLAHQSVLVSTLMWHQSSAD